EQMFENRGSEVGSMTNSKDGCLGVTPGRDDGLQFSRTLVTSRWILAGCLASLLLPLAIGADSLDEIKADLANCGNCPYRNLLQASLNYRLKMVQAAETSTSSIAGSVPGTSSRARSLMAGAAGGMTSRAGAGGGNPVPVASAAETAALRGQTAMSAYVSVYN